MEQILDLAMKVCGGAEVFSLKDQNTKATFQNGELNNIECRLQIGTSLRIIKNNTLGFAYTRNIQNRDEIVNNAIDSLRGKVDALFKFPYTTQIEHVGTCDKSIEDVSQEEIVEECARVHDILHAETNAEVKVIAEVQKQTIRIINNRGANLSTENTGYRIWGCALNPGTESGIYRIFEHKHFDQVPPHILDEIIECYKGYSNESIPNSGKMKVLFMPNSMVFFIWRILYGASARAVFEKRSSLVNKINTKVFSEKITLYDNPLDGKYFEARTFDDEGVRCELLNIINNGTLSSFFYDLDYAHKLGVESTGHGYKTDYSVPESISRKPIPYLKHLRIKSGNSSFSQLIKEIDRGVIIEDALGPHAGNLFNGDYSIGIDAGFYVENGRIKGRVKDAMITGNVYDTFSNVIDLSNAQYPCYWYGCLGRMPAILCDDVSVTVRK